MLAGRPNPGAIVAEVIPVHPINHLGPTSRRGDRRQQAMQFLLAGVTAAIGIAGVAGIIQLRSHDFPVADAKPGRLLVGLLTQMGRQSW